MKNYKVLFADLDGTIIKTKSGETFPKGIWDMEFRVEVLDAIKKVQPLALLIVSNQGGVESGFVNRRNFEFKMEYLGYFRLTGCYYNSNYNICRFRSTHSYNHITFDLEAGRPPRITYNKKKNQ